MVFPRILCPVLFWALRDTCTWFSKADRKLQHFMQKWCLGPGTAANMAVHLSGAGKRSQAATSSASTEQDGLLHQEGHSFSQGCLCVLQAGSLEVPETVMSHIQPTFCESQPAFVSPCGIYLLWPTGRPSTSHRSNGLT